MKAPQAAPVHVLQVATAHHEELVSDHHGDHTRPVHEPTTCAHQPIHNEKPTHDDGHHERHEAKNHKEHHRTEELTSSGPRETPKKPDTHMPSAVPAQATSKSTKLTLTADSPSAPTSNNPVTTAPLQHDINFPTTSPTSSSTTIIFVVRDDSHHCNDSSPRPTTETRTEAINPCFNKNGGETDLQNHLFLSEGAHLSVFFERDAG